MFTLIGVFFLDEFEIDAEDFREDAESLDEANFDPLGLPLPVCL